MQHLTVANAAFSPNKTIDGRIAVPPPQPQVTVVINEVLADATGAGDAFWSGFLFAYLKDKSPQKCLESALKMAAIKLQNVGRIPDYANVIADIMNQ